MINQYKESNWLRADLVFVIFVFGVVLGNSSGTINFRSLKSVLDLLIIILIFIIVAYFIYKYIYKPQNCFLTFKELKETGFKK